MKQNEMRKKTRKIPPPLAIAETVQVRENDPVKTMQMLEFTTKGDKRR